ncbi:hypothetical protein [Rhodococcus sp. IEGM 1379]|uniref:hypothetical protein n=1 Tax=Rhodococcus sp. IEGM 1379 TaxID=3047086 RepID=UPI0024B791BC|nr:hypothetical protein [Rhodococcus sp. IEGM 1379]MDI9914007.1 hypothetical protein [Rhodococcus sp. IEGM 1379]
MTDMMTALFGGHGPDWVAREVPVPEPGPGQILVRTNAVALNNADPQMLAEFDRPDSDHEYIAGYEFSGQVAALGTPLFLALATFLLLVSIVPTVVHNSRIERTGTA